MRLRIRKLQVRVLTDSGRAGAEFTFPDGLVVLQSLAPGGASSNTVGKSSLLNGILYALGLEGMLGPGHDVPLPHAFTDWLEIDGETHRVLESRIALEIEGVDQQVLTIERAIKGSESRALVKTWGGSVLGEGQGRAKRRDFFVRQGGAAKRERGFHRFLEEFIGWELPVVPRYRDDPEKLYMEAIWPLLYVEQKQGWSVIEGRFPTYLGIKQMGSRAIEFLLALDAYELSAQRVSLSAAEAALRAEWDAHRRSADQLAGRINAIVENLPAQPTGDWPPPVEPRVVVPRGDGWLPIREVLTSIAEELHQLEESELPRVENVMDETETALAAEETRRAALDRSHEARVADLEAERSQLESIEEKIDFTEADLQKHKDLLKLKGLGSDEAFRVGDGACPTCHQELRDSLMSLPSDQEVMTLADNVGFLQDQLSTFRFMQANGERAVEAKERAVAAGIGELEDVRTRIRDLKRTLVSDGRLPSQAALRTRMQLEARIEELERAAEDVRREISALAHVADKWREVQKSRAHLPTGELSEADREKIDRFRDVFIDQLRSYGLRSLDPSSLEISFDNYRPTHQGIDLQFDLSGSDTIRTIWAYRLALLQVRKLFPTNHPGLLVVDEPGQQEVTSVSVEAFFKRCLEASEDSQILVATSEEKHVVEKALAGEDAHVIELRGFVLSWL
jgi:hypothetical protein